ncbi:MAG: NAD-dependent epimerase/dehydratase family protein [Rhizobiaceae bacterium]|nr:MAG: NAD-dependent epimerase/dehydratase family protein [Rhizobiaceae bacterium]
MFVIMGATGHVGSATARALLEAGEHVTIVTRHAGGGVELRKLGAEIAVADVEDVATLRAAFQRGRRALLLNPPGDVTKDSDAIERRGVANILAALVGSGLEKVVAESTAGAQPGDRIGDLSVLWELEQGLLAQPIPAAINRAAYYMSNWNMQLESAYETGTLTTMFPADLKVPMIAPADLGEFAAERLLSSHADVGIRMVEGPARYSSREVADAFASALDRQVSLKTTPAGHWKDSFLELGFSEEAADSYGRMTQVTVEIGFDAPGEALRGRITLQSYVDGLAKTLIDRHADE